MYSDSCPFFNRRDAGRELAMHLHDYKGRAAVVVLALSRGGVPVGYEVARALGAPLDVFLVRKLGVPGHRELSMGTIASGGVRLLDREVLDWYKLPTVVIDVIAQTERAELERRERSYRVRREPLSLRARTAILVDDGVATGSTMKAAVVAVREHQPARVVVAVPVASPQARRNLATVADSVICAREPVSFQAIGPWYADFTQTSDIEVRTLLSDASSEQP